MIGPIKPFNSIGEEEMVAAAGAVVTRPLSGYLAGQERGGFSVRALEDAWCETFGVKHAIACSNGTTENSSVHPIASKNPRNSQRGLRAAVSNQPS